MLFQEQPLLHNPHYRAVFDILVSDNIDKPWRYIVRGVINWINNKKSHTHIFNGDWLYTAGEGCDVKQTVSVKTVSFLGKGTTDTPQYWALSLQESCNEHPNLRNWFTDITLTTLSKNKYRFSILNNYLIRPGYIGDPITPPTPTTPYIVQHYLKNKQLECSIGNFQLQLKPKLIRTGRILPLTEVLISKDRIHPILYISPNPTTPKYLLQPTRMAKLLAGNAEVYFGGDLDVNAEMEWVIPEKYRCTKGMVRVYMPGVNFHSRTDYRRHRFFMRRDIEDIGSDVIENNIVRGLARESQSILRPDISSYKDIINLIRQNHVIKIRERNKPQDILREIEALSLEKSELISENNQLLNELDKELDQSENLKIELLTTRSKCKRLAAKLKEYASKKDFGCKNCLSYLHKFPENLSDTINIIEKVYNGRIRFTNKAKKNAKKEGNIDIGIAWNCLCEMATKLYDLYFSEETDGIDIEKEFSNQTIFSLALNEGKATRNDPKLMKLRQDEYCGEKITIQSHVKYGTKGPKLLRVYYYPDHERGLLIVGHCGRHLPNSSSRKRK